MTEPQAGSLTRVSGNVALDYANTVSWRGTAQEVDHLRTVDLLLGWFRDSAAAERAAEQAVDPAAQPMVQPPVLHSGVVTRLQRLVRSQPQTGDRLLLAAMQLRASLTAVGASVAAGAAPVHEHLEVLKRAGVAALGSGRIVTDASRAFRFDFHSAPPEAALLGPIAWAAIDLLRSDQLQRLKQCPACDCRWLFLDTTKNGSRRWCDMATCGNRNKVMRFRRLGASPSRRDNNRR